MSESNSLVKLFNDIMKGMDDDDEKKVQQFTPEGVPAMIARPPEPPVGRPLTSEYVDTGIPHFETRLNDPTRGIIQPDGKMGTHQMRAEIDPATGKMTAFPMIVDMPGLGRLHQFKDPGVALNYNKALNNVKVFDDPQKGIDYAKGGYKRGTALAPEEVTPRVEENQTVRQKQEEYYLNTLGGLDPRQLRSANSIRAEITGPNNNNRGVPLMVKDPGFVEKALASAGLPSTDSMKRKASEELSKFGNVFSSPEAFGRQLASSFSLPGEVVKGAVKRGTDLTAATVEAVGDPVVRFGQGFAGTDVTGIEKGSFGRYYPEKQTEEQKVPLIESQSEIPTLDEPLKVEKVEQEVEPQKVEQEVASSNQAVVDPNNQDAKSSVDAEVDRLLEEGLPRGMMGDDGSLEFEPVDPDKLDTGDDTGEVEDPKQGFLSKLWDGVKDIIVNQVKDPANQRALFAYAVSRALGYDGVTFATQVLADSYEAKAAQQKQDHERIQKILDKELDFKYDMMGKVFDAKLEGNLKAGEKKSKIFNAIETRARNARENAINNAIAANPNLDEKEVRNRLNNVLNNSTVFNAVASFVDQYGNTPGFSEFTTAPAIEAGISSFAQQVATGKAKAKDLASYFEFQKLALSQTPAVSANLSTVHDSEEVVSNDEWSRASGQVSRITGRLELQMQSQSGVAGKADKAKIWSALEIEYNRQIQERGDSFAKYWQNISKKSLTKNGRQTSPALAWINSIGKPGDVAEPQFYPGDYNTVINNMFGKR